MKVCLALALTVAAFAQDRVALLGERTAGEIRSRTKPADGAIQEYVRSVAARVAPGIPVETVTGDIPGATWVPGHVFVPVEVLTSARSEAELAAVIAHAAAHHISGEGALIAEEARADREAIAALASAGYNPAAMADYLARMMPHNKSRIAAARADLPQRTEWIDNTSEFVRVREQLRPRRKAPSLYLDKHLAPVHPEQH